MSVHNFVLEKDEPTSGDWRKHGLAKSAIAFGLLIIACVAQSGEVRQLHPMLVRATVLQGKEHPVCAAYANALEQTVFTNYPHCGRWSVASINNGFVELQAKALSVAEYQTLYDSVQPFYFPGYRADQQKFSNEKAKNSQKYSESRSFSLNSAPALGTSWLIEAPPAYWLIDFSQGEKLALWTQSPSECGKELSNGRIGDADTNVFLVNKSGQVDLQKTALLLRDVTAKRVQQIDAGKSLTKDSLVANSFGGFKYDNEVFLDTFEGNPVVSSATPRWRFEGKLLVFKLNTSEPELLSTCEIQVLERMKPWRFAN